MQPSSDIPYCPIPPETISDMVPMVVVIGLFVLVGWLLRRWKKKRSSTKR